MTPSHWIAVSALLVAAWMLRYDMQPPAPNSPPITYMLDRWTGDVYVASPAMFRRVNQAKALPAPEPH